MKRVVLGNTGGLERLKMSNLYGIIAEDDSDYNTLRVLLNRILGIDNVRTRKAVGKGGAKVKIKCRKYAQNLKRRGCNRLIVMHDLDGSDKTEYAQLMNHLSGKLSPCPIDDKIIVIPVQEIEGWLLSDVDAIKQVFGEPNKKVARFADPETVEDPKEEIGEIVKRKLNKRYLNTIHNEQIAEKICLDRLYQCDSYKPLFHFVKETETEWDRTTSRWS